MSFKIALLRAANPAVPYQVSMPPLGLGHIAAVLKREMSGTELSFHRDAEEIVTLGPDLVCLSSATENWPETVEIAQTIKARHDIPILVGGMHITAIPETLPPEIDIGVIGEGEDTVLELVEVIRRHGPSLAHLRDVRGICLRDERGAVEQTPPRPPIDPLDRLPLPDRELLGDDWATPREHEVHLMSSRGCPYACHFCTAARWGKVRYFSPEYTVREIEWLLDRCHPEWIYFFDDLFVGHRKRFRAICDLIRERGLHRRVRFRTYARVNLIDEDLCRLMRDHSFHRVDLGIETNSARVMRYYNKTGITPEKNQRALDLLSQFGLSAGTNFIFGAPVETQEDMEETLAFIRRNTDKMDRMACGALQAPPGSGVHRELVEKGLIDNSTFDWHRQINREENFRVGDDGHLLVSESVSPQWFEQFMRRAFALSHEINLRGELADRDREMARLHRRLGTTQREIDSLRGSRLVRLAMWLRGLVGRRPQ